MATRTWEVSQQEWTSRAEHPEWEQEALSLPQGQPDAPPWKGGTQQPILLQTNYYPDLSGCTPVPLAPAPHHIRQPPTASLQGNMLSGKAGIHRGAALSMAQLEHHLADPGTVNRASTAPANTGLHRA